jgi:predicted transcriptional regulator of viral defense system
MNIFEFSKIFQNRVVFSIQDIEKNYPNFERENLLNWQKKGVLMRIRNGWYALLGKLKNIEDTYFVANKIYAPSYISMESALSHYGWIPEGVFTITSISTLKTNQFDTPIGRFQYYSIKPTLFFGYKVLSVEGRNIKIADPEKTLLDFLYFHKNIKNEDDLEAYRFNYFLMKKEIDWKKIEVYKQVYNSQILDIKLSIFKTLLDHAESF